MEKSKEIKIKDANVPEFNQITEEESNQTIVNKEIISAIDRNVPKIIKIVEQYLNEKKKGERENNEILAE